MYSSVIVVEITYYQPFPRLLEPGKVLVASRYGETETLETIHGVTSQRGVVIRLSEEHDRADFRASITVEHSHLSFPPCVICANLGWAQS